MTRDSIDNLCIRIKTAHLACGEKLLHAPVLSAGNIENTLTQVIKENNAVYFIKSHRWVLELGAIPAAQFNRQFSQRLAQAFAERLAVNRASVCSRPEITDPAVGAGGSKKRLNPPADARERYQHALDCLNPATLQRQLQESTASGLQQRLGEFLEHVPRRQKMLPASGHCRVTASRLSLAALLFLSQSPQGRTWLSQHSPVAGQITAWAGAVALGEIPPCQVAQLLTGHGFPGRLLPASFDAPPGLIRRWLLPLWQQNAVRHTIRQQEGTARERQIDAYLGHSPPLPDRDARPACPVHPVSNAGLLLLWPLLPELFSRLALCEHGQFVSDGARWQALYCLEWLAWGTLCPDLPSGEERLTLNRLLCGISLATPAFPSACLDVQRQQIDEWLTGLSRQLPGWQPLSLTDIRQLFLQRAGEINVEKACSRITVQSQPYDYLLKAWPWPMTLASFPWCEYRLTVIWPLNGVTGQIYDFIDG